MVYFVVPGEGGYEGQFLVCLAGSDDSVAPAGCFSDEEEAVIFRDELNAEEDAIPEDARIEDLPEDMKSLLDALN